MNTKAPINSNSLENWRNEKVFAIHKMPAFPFLVPFEDMPIHKKKEESSYYVSLNGRWKFAFYNSPHEVPTEYYQWDFDDGSWGSIPVPSNWQMHSYGKLIYTNQIHPFDAHPPEVPYQGNETGVYRKHFILKGNRLKQASILRMEGVQSAFELFVNGNFVGYSQDSMSPAEFDISAFVNEGDNLLALKVLRWCDGTYLEKQDFWDMSGIFRNVGIYFLPPSFVKDINIQTRFSDDYSKSSLEITGLVHSHTKHPCECLRFILKDKAGNEKCRDICQWLEAEAMDFPFSFKKDIFQPHLWSAENPYLYDLYCELKCKDLPLVWYHLKVGFRDVKIHGQKLLVNGNAVVIKGVNRHEFDTKTGRAISEESMVEDIKLIKQNNFNAIRNAHYPNQSRWYELCDEYGIYLMDEANVESHYLWKYRNQSPVLYDSWTPAIVARGEAMVQQNKNHPSVIIWSLGNESGDGPALQAMYKRIKTLDVQKRPIHYEGKAMKEPLTNEGVKGFTLIKRMISALRWFNALSSYDFNSAMYPTPSMVRRMARKDKKRPILICEYSHAMGNSNGHFKEYWDVFESLPEVVGGYIWDWADQGIEKQAPDGQTYYAYGGDFGDEINDRDFVLNGICFPNRSPKPALHEIKKVQQWIKFRLIEDNILELHNTYETINLNQFLLEWVVIENGKHAKGGQLFLPSVLPGHRERITIPFLKPKGKTAAKYHLNIWIKTRQANAWAPPGHMVANEQFLLPWTSEPLKDSHSSQQTANIKYEESGNAWEIGTQKFTLTVDKETGLIGSVSNAEGQIVMIDGPSFNIWRAPVSNDIGTDYNPDPRFSFHAKIWEKYGMQNLKILNVKSSLKQISSSLLNVYAHYTLGNDKIRFRCKHRFSIFSTGEIHAHFSMQLPWYKRRILLPRFGVKMTLPEYLNEISWVGKGPHENYADRAYAAHWGQYKSKTKDMITPYIVPQENGFRSQAEQIGLFFKTGEKALSFFPKSAGFSIHPYSLDDLTKATHTFQLQEAGTQYLYIDQFQNALGSESFFYNYIDTYLIKKRNFSLEFEWRIE